MFSSRDFFVGVLLPAAIAAAVFLFARFIQRDNAARIDFLRVAGPVALIGGFLAAYPLIANTSVPFPPVAAADRLFWAAVLLLVAFSDFGIFEDFLPAVVRWVISAIVVGGVLIYVTQTARASRAPAEYWTLLAAIWAVLVVQICAFDAAFRRDLKSGSVVSLIGVTCIAGAACALIQMSGSQKYAQQGGAMVAAAGVGAAFLVLTKLRRQAIMNGGTVVAVVGVVGILLAISIEPLFVNVTVANALLIAAAAPLLWASSLLPVRQPWLKGAARLIVTAAPVLIALSLAGTKLHRDLNEPVEAYDPWAE
jgi:hypothetical protein